jgi:hypothetical protein
VDHGQAPHESADQLADRKTNDPELRRDSSAFLVSRFVEEDGGGGA